MPSKVRSYPHQEYKMKREFDWFDKPDNLKKLRIFSYVILAASILAEFLIPPHVAHHPWDKIPGIYALFGFVICVAMIIFSKFVGQYWLKRKEDYYDR